MVEYSKAQTESEFELKLYHTLRIIIIPVLSNLSSQRHSALVEFRLFAVCDIMRNVNNNII